MGNNELENRISQLEKENALLLQWQSEVNALCGRLMQMIGNHDKKLEEFELDSLQLKYDMITYKAALDSLPY